MEGGGTEMHKEVNKPAVFKQCAQWLVESMMGKKIPDTIKTEAKSLNLKYS